MNIPGTVDLSTLTEEARTLVIHSLPALFYLIYLRGPRTVHF